MAVKVQLRRDTAANWASEDPVLAEGEIGVDTDARMGKIGDGSTAWSSLPYGFVGPAAPNRGTYSGATAYTSGDVVYNQGTSWMALQDTTGNAPPTYPTASNAYWQLMIQIPTGAGDFMADGTVAMTADFDGGGNNITNVGTVDGRDVSVDGAKLDYLTVTGAVDLDANNTKLAGIEASADVTDTANVTAAGALMDSELTNIAAVKALDQGVATTDGPQFATLELGHASDTTISRSAAGEAAVEGKRVLNTGDLSKQTIFIPAASMLAATTNGPASADIEATTNAQNYTVLDFDASTDEYAHFQIAMPKGWNEGTITFQVFWSTTATDTDGVAWGLQGVAVSDGDTVDASWGTAVVVTDDAQSAAGDVLVTAESSAVTIAGTPAAGDLCFFRLFRDVSDANDDMTEDARLVGVKLLYTIDALKDD